MLRFALISIAFFHGLIHLMGFAKAFHYGQITQLTKDISKPAGAIWLLAALMFIACAGLMLLKKEWWLLGLVAVLLSQALIFMAWQDSKYGSIANAIVLVATILAFGAWRFTSWKYSRYRATYCKCRSVFDHCIYSRRKCNCE